MARKTTASVYHKGRKVAQSLLYPGNNPKTGSGALKVPLQWVPPSAIHYLAMAYADGAAKYGPYNWREKMVPSMTYVGAMMRHIGEYVDGVNITHDSKVHPLAHVMACCAIILDAESIGMLIDDRPPKGAANKLHRLYNQEQVRKQKQCRRK